MTASQTAEALRREALCVQALAMIDGGASMNQAARDLGEPVANLCRYLKAYRAGGFEALTPKQPGKSGTKSLREKWVAEIGEAAVVEIEKRVAGTALDLAPHVAGSPRPVCDGLAWRTVARDPATPEPIRAYFTQPRRSKHHLAPSIREHTRPGPMIDARHHGFRAYGLAGPYQPRRLDILPGDIFSSDDTTPIWAWWVPWPKSEKYPHGAKLLQGQFLPVIDVASQHILCYALIAREQSSYRAADIWRLMGRVHSLAGLPRLGWQKERGSWEAKLIDGEILEADGHEPSHGARVGGLRMLPANLLPYHVECLGAERARQFRTLKTWTSYLPKSKSVEGIFHRLQRFEGTLWGTLGRSQQRRPFEKTVKLYEACRGGRADPRLHFLSGTELMHRLNACIEMHEAEPIEGEVFRGLPPETWRRGLEEHGPLLAEPPQGRWLMCRDWALVKAARGMVRIRRVDEVTDAPVSFFYSAPAFCRELDGRKVLIYFNRDAYTEPAHVLLPRADGAHEYMGTAEYVERVGMFLGGASGHARRGEQAGLVTTLYSDLAAYLPSRQVPAEIARRRREMAIEIRHQPAPPPPLAEVNPAPRLERYEKISKRRPTGVPGISYFESSANRRDGTVQRFFSAYTRTPDGRRKTSRFCLDTLGEAEAMRRAIEARGTYEQKVRHRGPRRVALSVTIHEGATAPGQLGQPVSTDAPEGAEVRDPLHGNRAPCAT